MQRRVFIHLSSYTAAALFLTGCGRSQEEVLTAPELLLLVADAESIRAAGAAYIQSTPAESTKQSITMALMEGIPKNTVQKIETSLNANIESDFKAGRIVIANGWVISLTEARQCALFSLT